MLHSPSDDVVGSMLQANKEEEVFATVPFCYCYLPCVEAWGPARLRVAISR